VHTIESFREASGVEDDPGDGVPEQAGSLAAVPAEPGSEPPPDPSATTARRTPLRWMVRTTTALLLLASVLLVAALVGQCVAGAGGLVLDPSAGRVDPDAVQQLQDRMAEARDLLVRLGGSPPPEVGDPPLLAAGGLAAAADASLPWLPAQRNPENVPEVGKAGDPWRRRVALAEPLEEGDADAGGGPEGDRERHRAGGRAAHRRERHRAGDRERHRVPPPSRERTGGGAAAPGDPAEGDRNRDPAEGRTTGDTAEGDTAEKGTTGTRRPAAAAAARQLKASAPDAPLHGRQGPARIMTATLPAWPGQRKFTGASGMPSPPAPAAVLRIRLPAAPAAPDAPREPDEPSRPVTAPLAAPPPSASPPLGATAAGTAAGPSGDEPELTMPSGRKVFPGGRWQRPDGGDSPTGPSRPAPPRPAPATVLAARAAAEPRARQDRAPAAAGAAGAAAALRAVPAPSVFDNTPAAPAAGPDGERHDPAAASVFHNGLGLSPGGILDGGSGGQAGEPGEAGGDLFAGGGFFG